DLWRSAYLVRDTTRAATRATAIVSDVLAEVVDELIGSARWPGARRLEPNAVPAADAGKSRS
ncbi:MAG: hypothetical protein VYD64_01440, partial [Pseudomonadota bacterium]|nr:hypothetical protein [Pseudomonadota bacterium]